MLEVKQESYSMVVHLTGGVHYVEAVYLPGSTIDCGALIEEESRKVLSKDDDVHDIEWRRDSDGARVAMLSRGSLGFYD